jgi:hypothetical protein
MIGRTPASPFRDASVTATPDAHSATRTCVVCGEPTPSPRATYCTPAHRMVAFRQRHGQRALDDELSAPTVRRPSRDHVVYACPDCEARYLGEQRCPECNIFCRRLGPGGCCPGCDEIVTIEELLGRS